jgi:hypothetical protein
LHFHERDLVQSLINFGYEEKNYTQENDDMLLTIGATPFIHISMWCKTLVSRSFR